MGVEEDKEGYVLFKTQDRGKGVCLKGNEPNSSLRDGEAFTTDCVSSSDQRWKLTQR